MLILFANFIPDFCIVYLLRNIFACFSLCYSSILITGKPQTS